MEGAVNVIRFMQSHRKKKRKNNSTDNRILLRVIQHCKFDAVVNCKVHNSIGNNHNYLEKSEWNEIKTHSLDFIRSFILHLFQL